jgi:hypothetical protein
VGNISKCKGLDLAEILYAQENARKWEPYLEVVEIPKINLYSLCRKI